MLYKSDKLLLIAGPCSLESESICLPVAETLQALQEKYSDLNIIFKGSFDKANRTSLTSERGPGIEAGLALLAMIKRTFGFPVVTDIHLPNQCAIVAQTCDILQIPAFLCRQTDLLVAAAKTGKVVNVKKGQFLSPYEMEFIVKKLEGSQAVEIWQTERGTLFGYKNLVVDMRSFSIMSELKHPTIFDATHSVQLPGAAAGQSGGQREYVPALAKAAIAAGAHGLFVETHPEPSKAISDGPSQIPLNEFPNLIKQCLNIWNAARLT